MYGNVSTYTYSKNTLLARVKILKIYDKLKDPFHVVAHQQQ